MRYRDYKIFAQDNYYHVINRGNNKADIFLDSQDYNIFINRMRENLFPEPKDHSLSALSGGNPTLEKYKRKSLPAGAFSLICYCLMPNHFHLLIRQNSEIKISKIIQKICTGYAIYFQKKYNRTGHLFQGAFKAIHIDNESYLMWLSAYIHQNPAVSEIVTNLGNYPYSSYPEYINLIKNNLCDTKPILDKFKTPEDYKNFVDGSGPLIKQRKDIEYLLLD